MQIELRSFIESMPVYGSIPDTPAHTQEHIMEGTLDALLDSLEKNNSSKGSIPARSISLRMMLTGMRHLQWHFCIFFRLCTNPVIGTSVASRLHTCKAHTSAFKVRYEVMKRQQVCMHRYLTSICQLIRPFSCCRW